MAESESIQPVIRRIEPNYDAASLIHLGDIFLGAEWSEAYLSWKYLTNPAGLPYGQCAEINGLQVGFYSDMPVRLKYDNRVAAGAQAVDLVVAAEAQRHGLFVKMANKNYEQMDQEGILLDYAFPNPVSEAGFIKRLGWTSVGRVPRYTRLLDASALADQDQSSRLKGWVYRVLSASIYAFTAWTGPAQGAGIQVREVSTFDERIDRFWQQAAIGFPIAVARDFAYLSWRYIQNPLQQYQVLIAVRGADLAGFCVISYRDRKTGRSAALAEFVVAPGDEQAGLALLDEAPLRARQAGCSQIHCWMLPHHNFYVSLLKRSGFLFWPNRFLPGLLRNTTPFIIRLRPGTSPDPDPRTLGNWFVTMGDHDYY